MKSTQQVAAELGVRQWRIRYAIEAGYIDKPQSYVGRFMFNESDIKTFRSYFSKHQQRKEHDDSMLRKLLD